MRLEKHYQKLSYRERVLVFWVTCICGLFLFQHFVLDGVQTLYRLSRETKKLEQENQRQEIMLQALRAQKQAPRQDPEFEAVLNANRGRGQLMRALANVDNQWEHFRLKRVVTAKSEFQGVQEITAYDVEIEAPFPSLARFLSFIEKSELLARVEGVSVFRTENELKLCQAKIRLVGHSWREQ